MRKKVLSVLLAAAMMFSLLPALGRPGAAFESPGLVLGGASLSGGSYYYTNAQVTGIGLQTILISFTGSVTAGDRIVLPASPAGFTVSDSSAVNNYDKRINLAGGVETSTVQDYLRGVAFEIAGAAQSVDVTVTTDDIQYDTYYYAETEHYYQFVPLTLNTETWITSYNAAKLKSYMGRTGYLATVTSVEEDAFIKDLSGNVGWLGGTRMTYNAGTDTFDPAATTGFWYWAGGPEKGHTFYDTQYVTAGNYAATDSTNAGLHYYFNWNRLSANEPNSSAINGENCLTTLHIGAGYAGTSGYSWNDRDYTANHWISPASEYEPYGYIAEFGDQAVGDSGGGSAAFASGSGTLYDPTSVVFGTESWQSAAAYTCGVELPVSAKMVTVSVDSGYFTVPALGGILTFLGGTSGTSYISAYDAATPYDSAVFSFSNVSAAETLLSGILYTPDGMAPQTITATSSAVSPVGSDIYFEGHFYRYIAGNISWPNAVISAGGTADPYFGGRGYIATATSQAENSILLRLVDTGLGGDDHWYDVWMGGLWQRNTGTVDTPTIIRGINGNEITYANISTAAADINDLKALLVTYSDLYAFTVGVSSTYICNNASDVLYYWIDGPEAGLELPSNTAGFAPWHASGGVQDEPNRGDFIYIGWQGAFWDDLAAYTGGNFDARSGYIVEFSGFDGGSAAGIIKSDTKTVGLTEISTVTVTDITTPKQGQSPDATAVCATAGITGVSAVTWAPAPAANFDYGTAYTAAVTLTAGNGYRFAANPAGTINGAAAAVTRDDDAHITVTYAFSATNAPYIPQPETPGTENIPVIIDGVEHKIGTATPETDGTTGVQTTVVTVDEDEFSRQLANASDSVIIPVPELSGSTAQKSVLTASMVDSAAQRDMTLEVQYGDVRYVMRADAVSMTDLATRLGAPNGELGQINVNITISDCSEAQVRAVENADSAGTWTLIVPPVAFTVSAEYNGQTVNLDTFDLYADRVIALPDGADPAKITTALVVTGSGNDYHVPTEVFKGADGKWYASIHSLTNSVYALVWNDAGFSDAAGQWYEDIADEMASRMIVKGRSADIFDGGAFITRAEFAAIIIRALGLPENGTSSFSDVPSGAWYGGAVGKAFEYGIIFGRGNNLFDPTAYITREEAMAMIRRAAAVTELKDIGGSAANGFPDYRNVSGWAAEDVAFNLNNGLIVGTYGLIRPADTITRAETATVVLRLLQESGLVDVRSQA
jgi:hypothetical protein